MALTPDGHDGAGRYWPDDHEFDLSAMDTQFKSDEVGASGYDSQSFRFQVR